MPALFACTLLVGSALLFLLLPMSGREMLARFGGSSSVWSTCLLFGQLIGLGASLYAWVFHRILNPRRQAALHSLLVLAAWIAIWPVLSTGSALSAVPDQARPIGWLLSWLAVSIGGPCFVLAATVPLLQAWLARLGRRGSGDPYSLYAASCLGGVLALAAYPRLTESSAFVEHGTQTWTWGYALFSVLVLLCGVALWRSPAGAGSTSSPSQDEGPGEDRQSAPAEDWGMRFRWMALALVPSSLLLSVTARISSQLAAVPLVWAVPLALHLLSFVLVFARPRGLPLRPILWVQPLLLVPAAACVFIESGEWLVWLAVLHVSAVFLVALVCHGQLAVTRPAAGRLTGFYMWISIGGVLGAVFNVLLAPGLFSWAAEYPLILLAACLLRPAKAPADRRKALTLDLLLPATMASGLLALLQFAHLCCKDPSPWAVGLLGLACMLCLGLAARPLRLALGVLAVLGFAAMHDAGPGSDLVCRRNFFGRVKVRFVESRSIPTYPVHIMYCGSVYRGSQVVVQPLKNEPQSYYHRTGPLGQMFDVLGERFHRVAVIGTGTGSIAAYGRPEMEQTFYEINPDVLAIAQNSLWFTYLRDSRAAIRTVLGDGRQALASPDSGRFDLLVLDSFNCDAFPAHQLTREAMHLYLDRLADDGVLAVHVTHPVFDLAPIVGRLAEAEGAVCRQQYAEPSPVDASVGKLPSHWVLVVRRAESLGKLLDDAGWKPISVPEATPLWTDAYCDVLPALRHEPQTP